MTQATLTRGEAIMQVELKRELARIARELLLTAPSREAAKSRAKWQEAMNELAEAEADLARIERAA